MLQMMQNKAGLVASSAAVEFRPEMYRHYAGQAEQLAADESRQVLNGYLRYLEVELSTRNLAADVGKSQEMLLEVSQFIHSGNARVSVAVYRCVLKRLAVIYAQGLSLAGGNIYVQTAADYADVIESISRIYPDYDYSEIVGQLIHYMNQLFKLRKKNWQTVYEHIVSMLDATVSFDLLKNKHISGLRQWAEEGVGNLFRIEEDIQEEMRRLDREIFALERRMTVNRGSLAGRCGGVNACGINLVDLDAERIVSRIRALDRIKAGLIRERTAKADVLELIKSNILEFEDKLKAACRVFSIRLVATPG